MSKSDIQDQRFLEMTEKINKYIYTERKLYKLRNL